MSEADTPRKPRTPDDLLERMPETAYFWGRVAGDGELTSDCLVVRTSDETAADALAAIAGTDERSHEIRAHESAHDASIVRYEDEYELKVFGPVADRAAAALGLPIEEQRGGYRFGVFDEFRPELIRGILESSGTICFRESSGVVGISFVHDDAELLETVQSILADSEVHAPTEELSESSSGGYWFGLDDDADISAFAEWLYEGSSATGLYSADRRTKLRRCIERATDTDVGVLSE